MNFLFPNKENLDPLLREIIDLSKKLGVDYSDLRYGFYKSETINVRDNLVEAIDYDENFGVGIRVLVNGGWGFSSTAVLDKANLLETLETAIDIAKASSELRVEKVCWEPQVPQVGTWCSNIKEDPFKVSREEKMNLLLDSTSNALQQDGCFRATASIFSGEELKWFLSSEGSDITQRIIRTSPDLMAWGKASNGNVRTRNHQTPPLTCGFENIRSADLVGNAARVGSEAVERAQAPFGPQGKFDLILDPANLALTIHETIGHATELDRACGWEADFAGTSFLKVSDLDNLKYGSKWVNVQGDRTLPNGQATLGWDDDGVKTNEFPIIEKGIFRGFASTRDSCYLEKTKGLGKACSHADSWSNIPILRIPNVSLKPSEGESAPSKNDLIKDVKKGILIQGRGSWSIDQQRYNFQFGGDAFWEIRNGEVCGMFSDVTYRGITTDFWNSCDGVSSKDYWEPQGVRNCGKGQPSQQGQQTHGASWSLFRNIDVGDAN